LAIYNTFKLGLITATVGTLLATLIAYITNRNLFRGARYLSFFALAPLVIPGIVLAVGLFIVYTRPPLVLYGTIWILFVAFLTKEMPIGFSQAESTFKSIHPELEDASRIIGANRLMSLKDVTAPLARSGLIAAWSFIFIGVIRELSAAILFCASRKLSRSFSISGRRTSGDHRSSRNSFAGGFLRGHTCGPVVRRTGRGGDAGIAHGNSFDSRSQQTFRRRRGGRRSPFGNRRRRIRVTARPFRLRQNYHAAFARRLLAARRRGDSRRWRSRFIAVPSHAA
jgi:ABC-type molybdate transport system permease subunit